MIRVRDAVAGDADAICDAHVTAWRVAYRGLFRDEYLDAPAFDTSRRTNWLAWNWPTDYGGELLVPEVHGDVVGFAHIGRERSEPDDAVSDRGEIYGFYLHPLAWGSGAATLLMDECHVRLRAAGFEQAMLWVLRDNPRARAFYEKAGWAWSGETKLWSPRDEAPVAEVEYARSL